MFDNARTYNIAGSQICDDVDRMQAVLRKACAKMPAVAGTMQEQELTVPWDGALTDPSSIRPRRKLNALEQQMFSVWQQVMTACSGSGRRVGARLRCKLLIDLPSMKHFADYYRKISEPVSLADIFTRIDGGRYKAVEAFRADLMLVFANAKRVNGSQTEVHDDAAALEKLVQCLLPPVEVGLPAGDAGGAPSGQRKRGRSEAGRALDEAAAAKAARPFSPIQHSPKEPPPSAGRRSSRGRR